MESNNLVKYKPIKNNALKLGFKRNLLSIFIHFTFFFLPLHIQYLD